MEAELRVLPEGSFAILDAGHACGKCDEPDDCEECADFMQTCRESGGRFCLEYFDGRDDRLYRCRNENLDLDWVLRAFRSYGRGDSEFKQALEWKPAEPEGAVRVRPALAIALVAACLAIVAFALVQLATG